jgi:hypothetical protein
LICQITSPGSMPVRLTPVMKSSSDRGVHRGEHRQAVARRAGRAHVPADGPGVAHLGRPDGSSSGGQRRQHVDQVVLDLRPGRPRPQNHLVIGDRVTLQLIDPTEAHDRRRATMPEVDLDHEVGAARQQMGIGHVIECVVHLGQRRGVRDRHLHLLC